MKTHLLTRILASASLMLVLSRSGRCQGPAGADAPNMLTRWRSNNVVFIAGLPDVKPDSLGSLSLTPSTVAFTGKNAAGDIAFARITAVSVGDERVATGGTSAKVARHIPFFGFGAAVGAVTNKKVDLLTIEYQDMSGGYHGAVFEVPKTQAVVAQQQLSLLTTVLPVASTEACSHIADLNAMLVAPIVSADVDLPAEYRVLLYEQLVEQLKMADGTGTVYRAGNTSAPCAAKTLQLSVTAFKKGNEAVRSSTGPVGFFVGGTSVTFHIRLSDHLGTVLFEKSLKENKRGDGDSLSVTRDLAKSVSKRLLKAKQFEAPAKL